MTPVLEMKNVEKRFGGVKAIDNFGVQIMPNTIHGLIGPNGAGKTTIFNNITGIYRPDNGTIFFNGENITNTSPHLVAQLGIARTFQNIRLFSNLSVLSNVIIASNIKANYSMLDAFFRTKNFRTKRNDMEDKAMELLKIVGLQHKANERASSLPYGHQRKLEIARAMALEPKLLLLDEPAAGMNSDESLELVGFIKEIKEQFSLAVLMIEHHMDVVTNLCDSVTVLNFGENANSRNTRRSKKTPCCNRSLPWG